MKIMTATFMLVMACFLGCTQTYRVRQANEADLAALNKRTVKKFATVTLRNDRKIAVKELRMNSDSTYWDSRAVIATSKIKNVQFLKRGRGAIDGMGVGLAFGVFGGYAAGEDDPGGIGSFDRKSSAILVGILGTIIGAPVGALRGHSDVYIIEHNAIPVQEIALKDTLSNESHHVAKYEREEKNRHWSVFALIGETTPGPHDEIISVYRNIGFSGDFISTGDFDSFLLGISYRLSKSISTGLMYSVAGSRESVGYDLSAYSNQIATKYSSKTLAMLLSFHMGPVKVSFGPAIYFINYSQRASPINFFYGIPSEKKQNPGFVTEFALKFPSRSLLFVELRFQYRLAGEIEIGSNDRPTDFPETNVNFDHRYVGLGFGLRF